MEDYTCYSDELDESLHFDGVALCLTVYNNGEETLHHWYDTEEDYSKAMAKAKALNWKEM